MAHALVENRPGLIVDIATTQATGTAEMEGGGADDRPHRPQGTGVGADKSHDQPTLVAGLGRATSPPVARKKIGSAVDGRRTRGKGHTMTLRCCQMIEEAFGWIKTVGGMRKTRHKGLAKVSWQLPFCFAAYNLTRLLRLLILTPTARVAPA